MQDLELEKVSIVAEYLTKDVSFRELGQKYGVRYPTIHAWVQEFKSVIQPVSKKGKGKRKDAVAPPGASNGYTAIAERAGDGAAGEPVAERYNQYCRGTTGY